MVLGSNSVAIKCCILGTRSTYSPVNFNWELVDRKLFLHFSKSLANILAESLVYIFFLCFHFFIFTLHNKTLVYVSYLFSFGIYFFHEQWFYNFFDSSNFCYIKPQWGFRCYNKACLNFLMWPALLSKVFIVTCFLLFNGQQNKLFANFFLA